MVKLETVGKATMMKGFIAHDNLCLTHRPAKMMVNTEISRNINVCKMIMNQDVLHFRSQILEQIYIEEFV